MTRKYKIKITKNENVVPHLEIVEILLMHYNIFNNYYQQDSRIMYAFVSNKSFGQLLIISPNNFIFLKTNFRIFIY